MKAFSFAYFHEVVFYIHFVIILKDWQLLRNKIIT